MTVHVIHHHIIYCKESYKEQEQYKNMCPIQYSNKQLVSIVIVLV
jgi:hypothetical protein